MRRDKLRFLRNIGIAAHIDAGKTTLTERILYFTGKSHKMGETHKGNSQMDTTKQEIEKGITISSAATHTTWQYKGDQYSLNIIDTPGHVDFMIEVERSLRILDGMVALFDAVAGVEAQSETVWQQAARHKVPIIAMVNKMDRVGADYLEVVRQIDTQLGANALAIQLPIGAESNFEGVIDLIEMKATFWNDEGMQLDNQPIPTTLLTEAENYREVLIEKVVMLDETMLNQYFENPESISAEQIRGLLRKAVLERQIVPVLMGAAYKNKGIQTLLDAVSAYLPSPLDRGALTGFATNTKEVITRAASNMEPFTALVFKIALDDQNRQLCFFRVYAGSLKIGDTITNPRTNKKERIGRLYQIHANKKQEIQQVMAGDIAATTGLKAIQTGDTLCAIDAPIVLERLYVPAPVITMAIEAKNSVQLDKLSIALSKLQLEDPSFQAKTDTKTGQTVILGMGELHLEIIIDKLKEDFGLAVKVGSPKVAYQEGFTKMVRRKHRLKRQRGGQGLYAEIEVQVGPADTGFLESGTFLKEGKRLQFVNKVVGGSIPKEFIPAVENGFTKMLESGPLADYPIQSLKVVLLDGDTHIKDSSPKAFETCAMETFRVLAMDMKPQLLEPLVEVIITAPNGYLGNILSGINRRRGLVLSQSLLGQQVQLTVEVPLAEMFGYINHLRTVSAGRANYSMKFKRYAVVPSQIVNKAISLN